MADSQLTALLDRQQRQTRTFLGKLWQFFRIVFLRHPNDFEQYLIHAEPNDLSFVAKYSEVQTLDTSRVASVSVPSVSLRCLHAPHPLVNFAKVEPLGLDLVSQLAELPALLFVHGLGGQMSQFESLMGLLLQCSEIYALDLPGFGDSRPYSDRASSLDPESRRLIGASILAMSPEDFLTACIAEIIVQYIAQNIPPHKKIILIGHSMGTHLLIKVACRLQPQRVEGLVLLAPPGLDDDVHEPAHVRARTWPRPPRMLTVFSWVPFVFDWFRVWDRLEGVSSKSVLRQLPASSSVAMRLRQLRWNLDIDLHILLLYARRFTPCKLSELHNAVARFNDNPHDRRAYEKTLLIGGLDDRVTPVQALGQIQSLLNSVLHRRVAHVTTVRGAGHALLLAKPEFISGIVLNHLEKRFPERLHISPAWVLKLKALISGDKWGLKNELKWLQTQSVSHIITRRSDGARAPLLGMKTLREGDPLHSPAELERHFHGGDRTSGNLVAIVDISADIPPYSPKSFVKIDYYKCATVSKVVPDAVAVRRFIQLIDDVLSATSEPDALVAVHCHYGFNRTGYLICCFLIERLGWSVQDAIEGFKAARPPGIKHPHFIDALYVKYET